MLVQFYLLSFYNFIYSIFQLFQLSVFEIKGIHSVRTFDT